jgi:uncharacterized circularly permuted ATP-grasp superfamily protein
MSVTPFDEMHTPNGEVRPHYQDFSRWLDMQAPERLQNKRAEADLIFRRVGITFAVYGEESGTERLIPFDIVPRVIKAAEWKILEAGLRQRVQALNMFLKDIYNEQKILATGP